MVLNRYRIVHEFLFSLNIACVLRWENALSSSSMGTVSLQLWINRALHLHPHGNIGGYAAFYILAILEGVGIFVVLQVLSFVPSARKAALSAAGITSLVALPIAWLDFRKRLPGLQGSASLLDLPRWWLFGELFASVVVAVLFLRGRRLGGIGLLLLVVHFALWGWLFLGGPYFWLAPGKLVIPLVGFGSCMAWTTYVANERNFRRNPTNALVR